MAEDGKSLNFEAKTVEEIKRLFERIWGISEDERADYEIDWEEAFKFYYGWLDLTGRDPNAIHVQIPKPFANIESVTANDVKSLFGSSPYFPIIPNEKAFKANAEALESLIDSYADTQDFFTKGAGTVKGTRLTGQWILEPYWRWEIKYRHVETQKQYKGYMITGEKRTQAYIDEGLDWRPVPPWMCGVDPLSADIEKMRWFYIKQPVSKQELKKLMRNGGYLVKYEDLHEGSDSCLGTVGDKLKSDIGYAGDSRDVDMGLMIRLWLPCYGRYIEIWGNKESGIHVMRDFANPYTFIPPVVIRNVQDPFPERFWAIGEIRPSFQMFTALNDAYTQLLNTQQQSMNPPMLYPEGYIEPDQIVNSPGRWTPYDPSRISVIKDMMFQMPVQQLTRDAYEIPDRLSGIVDETSGLPAQARGQFPERKELAYTVRKVSEGSDARTATKLVFTERAMKQVAIRSWRIIEKNSTDKIKQQILGDRARFLLFNHPEDIPFGYEMKFKGSDLMTDREQKQTIKMSLFQMGDDAVANRKEHYKILLENSDVYSQDEIDRVTNLPQPAPMPEAGAGEQANMASQPPTNPPAVPTGASGVAA